MSKPFSHYIINLRKSLRYFPHNFWQWLVRYWQLSWLYKALFVFIALIILATGSMYGIARWYIASEQGKQVIGTSFIPAYAESLGLDPQQTMDALITDLGVKHFRLVSYWDQLEPTKGTYDFSLLDWQFKKAEAAHAKISLSLGLRQPRWPECHLPTWAVGEPTSQWYAELNTYIQAVVDRYKNSPSLESYQLENEYFLQGFGVCTDFSRDRLIAEFNTVKRADPHHPVIISRSNNAQGVPINEPTPDEYGISIYKRVWSPPIGRYIEYPFPAWYYGFLAGAQKLTSGKDMIIHELQMEAWPPHGKSITETSLAEQDKSIDAQRFKDRVEYGKATGMRSIYLWGSEYWYYRMTIMHDPSLWNQAKDAFKPQN